MLLHPKQWHMPGMEPITEPLGTEIKDVKEWREMSDPSKFAVEMGSQPYFKLHGSSNWIERSSGRPMLVIGGKKAATIGRHKILKWNNAQFEAYLSKPDTRLMIIGYSFRDEHINVTIRDAVEKNKTIRLFIIDPLGEDVLTKNRLAPPSNLPEKLQPHLIGASKRSLRETFGGDMVEHRKLMMFFD